MTVAAAPTAAVRIWRLLFGPVLIVAALVGALLAGASPAAAHAGPTGTTPAAGAVVDRAPQDVTLTFSDGVAMPDDAIRVFDPRGERADTGELTNLCSGNTVKYGVELRSGLPDGTYTVAWQAVSADGHPISGAFTFSVGAPSKAAVVPLPEQQVDGGLVGTLYGIGRFTAYAGFILLIGGGAFVLLCRPGELALRPVQRLVVQGWLTLAASTVVLLLLRGPYTASGKLVDAFDLGGLKAVLETRTGTALTSRLLLLAAAALFVAVLFGSYTRRSDPAERRDLAFGLGIGGTVVAAGLAATWALAEHASTGIQTGIAMPVDVLHLLAVSVWLGGLAALLVTLHHGPAVARQAVRRFSRLAFGSVLVLTATGLYQTWRQVGSWDALTSTSYGRLLQLKIGLIAALVAIAWFSRRWTARLSETAPTEQTQQTQQTAERTGDEAAERPVQTERAEEKDEKKEEEKDERVTVPDDPERAAQLARQRVALATARKKRVRDADPGRSGLRRSVLAEAAVAVVLLTVTTVLANTEPARTEQAVRAASGISTAVPDRPISIVVPFDSGGEDGRGSARIDLDPGRVGGNTLNVRLTRPDGTALDAPEVTMSFTLNSTRLGPLPAELARIETGHWSATGVQLPAAGDWQISVTVRTSDIDQVTKTRNVKIGS